MPPIYNPFDWYWRKRDGSAYHSRRQREFPADDLGYQEWLAKGHTPRPYPVDNYGNENRDWMLAILKPWNLRIYPLTEVEAHERNWRQSGDIEPTEDMLLPVQVEHLIEQKEKLRRGAKPIGMMR